MHLLLCGLIMTVALHIGWGAALAQTAAKSTDGPESDWAEQKQNENLDDPEKELPIEADPLFEGLQFVKGPVTASLSTEATLAVPEGYYFFDGNDARVILERTLNLPRGDEIGMLIPDDFSWFLLFSFTPTGYVSVPQDFQLDKDAMFASFSKSLTESKKEMEQRGWDQPKAASWNAYPTYNASRHSFEWSLRFAASDTADTLFFDTYVWKLLGRDGVMEVTLISDTIPEVTPIARRLLQTLAFNSGRGYSDWQAGDKTAHAPLYSILTMEDRPADSPPSRLFSLPSGGVAAVLALGVMLLVFIARKKT